MDAARKGIITREMELVARKEKRTAEEIRQWVAEGRAAIPCNRVHKALDPNGIGSMLKTKINVNLGTSRDCMDLDTEVEKVNRAVAMGAEAIMGSQLLWRYPRFPETAHSRMSGYHRHRTDLRRCGILSQGLKGDHHRRVAGYRPDARGGRRGLYDHPLRHQPVNGKAL